MSLIIITGSMMGGKTSKIIEMKREIEKNENNKILMVNHHYDSRYSKDEYIVSHNNQIEGCKKLTHLVSLLQDNTLKNFTHIFIDEGQFFYENDLQSFVKSCLFVNKQHVILSGLISNCNLNALGGICNLMRYADEILFLKGTCDFCKSEGSATCTYVNGVSSFNAGEDSIDMTKLHTYKFQPSCKKCWVEKVTEDKKSFF